MKTLSRHAVAGIAVLILLGSTSHLAGQQPATKDHSLEAHAAEMQAARRRFSPELERMRSLVGRWEGSTFREGQGTKPIVVTYALTGAGSAVIETLFAGTAGEMATVYHDDSRGHLVADHYCSAGNQPKLRLSESDTGRLYFVLAPDADIKADVEGHAHELTLAFGADGSLTHDWLNHYLGDPAAKRNIKLQRVK
jgi:hypothetical protein